MPFCTKRRCCFFCVVLAIYLFLNSILMVNDEMAREYMYRGQMAPREECVSVQLHYVDDTAIDMKPKIFCDGRSHRSDVICRWHLFQQTTGLTSMLKGKPTDDICLLPDDTFTGSGGEKAVVPKFVYYVLFGVEELTYLGYMSFLSVHKFVRPRAIYVLSDVKPYGEWWSKVEKDIGVKFILRQRPKWVGDKVIRFNSHAQNLVALQLLTVNGGIYIDTNMLILRSLHPLLKHNITLGLLSDKDGMGGDIILAKKKTHFTEFWHSGYALPLYNESDPHQIIRKRPYHMWERVQTRVHVESTRFYNPGIDKQDILYNSNDLDWSENYAMKIWPNPNFRYPQSHGDIKQMDNTLGQVLRHINRQ